MHIADDQPSLVSNHESALTTQPWLAGYPEAGTPLPMQVSSGLALASRAGAIRRDYRNHTCLYAPRFTSARLAPMAISSPPNTRFWAWRARAVASQRWAREARKA